MEHRGDVCGILVARLKEKGLEWQKWPPFNYISQKVYQRFAQTICPESLPRAIIFTQRVYPGSLTLFYLYTAKEFMYCQRIYILPKNLPTKECYLPTKRCYLPNQRMLFTRQKDTFYHYQWMFYSAGGVSYKSGTTWSCTTWHFFRSLRECEWAHKSLHFILTRRAKRGLLSTQVNQRLRHKSYIVTKWNQYGQVN